MREFYGPYIWTADQPQPSKLNWPFIGVVVSLTAFWLGVACLVRVL